MNRGVEYRLLMAAITSLCALAAVSGVVPIVEHLTGTALICAALGWLAGTLARRERRIRARLADPRTRPQPAPSPVGGSVPESPTTTTASASSTGGAR